MVKHQQKEQSNWIGYLQKKSREQLTQLAAHSNPSALDALAAAEGSGIVVMDHGFCPMGARRCQDGLALLNNEGERNGQYGPVPGGASNCVKCRFFITGPAFVVGMEAHVNDLAYRLKNKSYGYQKAQKAFDEISHERSASLRKGVPFSKSRELQTAEAAFEKTTADVDQVAHSLQAAYALTEQCLSIMNNDQAKDAESFALVVSGGGGIEAVLEEAHAFEQLQKICSSAVFFETLEIETKQANLERMRFFDQMLAKSGLSPTFCLIEDEDRAKKIADEMGRFLYSRLGKRDVAMLMDGKTTLQALGLAKEFPSKLQSIQKVLAAPGSSGARLELANLEGGDHGQG